MPVRMEPHVPNIPGMPNMDQIPEKVVMIMNNSHGPLPGTDHCSCCLRTGQTDEFPVLVLQSESAVVVLNATQALEWIAGQETGKPGLYGDDLSYGELSQGALENFFFRASKKHRLV